MSFISNNNEFTSIFSRSFEEEMEVYFKELKKSIKKNEKNKNNRVVVATV